MVVNTTLGVVLSLWGGGMCYLPISILLFTATACATVAPTIKRIITVIIIFLPFFSF